MVKEMKETLSEPTVFVLLKRQVITDVTWLRDHGICAMEEKGEGESLSLVAAPLERSPCFT